MGYCILGALVNVGVGAANVKAAYNIATGNIPEPQPSVGDDDKNPSQAPQPGAAFGPGN